MKLRTLRRFSHLGIPKKTRQLKNATIMNSFSKDSGALRKFFATQFLTES
jgi:hypothetical protein